MENRVKQNRVLHLILFFVISFLISWCIWIPAGIWAPRNSILVLPGAWAPTLAALLMTGFVDGKKGLKKLLKKMIKWRVKIRYYLFAIFGVMGIAILAVFIHFLSSGSLPDLGSIAARFGFPEDQALLFLLISPVVFITTIFVGGPIAEELGWRGYAQPRLQANMGSGLAGLIIGFIWSLWHLPLFWFFPSATGNLPIEYYVPLVSLLGILFAWLYNRSGESVLLCILLHAGVNFSLGVIGSDILTQNTQLLTIFILLTGGTAFILYSKNQNLWKEINPDESL